MRGVDHTEENRENSLLDIVGVLATVDGRGLINAQAPHLIGLHDRVRSLNHLSAIRGRKKRAALRS